MSTFTSDQIRVARNILAIAVTYRPLIGVPPLVHLAATKQEDGWMDENPGDAGQSHGPYQIYTPAHPGITARIATDPGFDYGFWEIHERWAQHWLPFADQWQAADENGRISILCSYVPAAQGSIDWTWEQAVNNYDDAVAMLELLS